MLGLLATVAAVAAFGACARNVPQNESSGKDYRFKGAKKIELEEGEARVRDIVTYPGGDRVDWKVVELPKDIQGTLDIKLHWQPPRPGLDLAFEVFDEYFDRVQRAKPSPGTGDRSKRVKVKNASGKYYIQVYAPRRTDAGRYVLSLRFRERAAGPSADELLGMIDDPPPLPAVIEPKEKTPEEIAAEEAERVRLEEERRVQSEKQAADNAALAELNKPVNARITRTQRSQGGVIITINAGQNRGVDKGWTGVVLAAEGRSALPGGEFTVIRVTKQEAIAKVQLSIDQVRANPRVELRRGQ
ncbi:MAG TPA: hypothetical protein VNM90_13930 [Haliangium sp.]|nr:hypothetical protein [Haliangium sp.]